MKFGFWFWFSVAIALVLIWGIFLSIKYRNPFKWYQIVGFPGSGKTTLAVKLTQQFLSKGWCVYSNIEIPGSYLIDPDDLGKFWQSPNSIIILDEIGLVWDNRKFKDFKDHSRDWAKKHRHHKHRVYSFSQSMDYDSKLRDVTDKLYLLVNYFGWFSVAKEITMKWVSVQPDANAEGRIAKAMIISPFILAPFGARIYTFIPHWIKYFDSFELPELPKKEYRKIQYPAGLKKKFIPKILRNSDFVQISEELPARKVRRTGKLNKNKNFAPSNLTTPPPNGSELKNGEEAQADEPVFNSLGPASIEEIPFSDQDPLFPI